VNAQLCPSNWANAGGSLSLGRWGGQRVRALHDAEFGTNEPSRAAREAGAKTAAERVAGFRSASTSGLAAGASDRDLRPRQRAGSPGASGLCVCSPEPEFPRSNARSPMGAARSWPCSKVGRRVAGIEPEPASS